MEQECHPPTNLVTLSRHVLHSQHQHSEASGDLTLLLVSIQLGCKYVSSLVRRAGLANVTGLMSTTNVQGEVQQKMDILAQQVFVNTLRTSGKVAVMVSEEEEQVMFVGGTGGKYCVVFDPLDGSSNIDCGVSIGTIFGIYHLVPGSS